MNTNFLIPTVIVFLTFGQSQDSAPAARWWKHMQFLASDKLEGRLTGTPGHRKAAEYAAEQLKNAGLKPAGTDGYFQPVDFVKRLTGRRHAGLIFERQSQLEAAGHRRAADVLPIAR